MTRALLVGVMAWTFVASTADAAETKGGGVVSSVDADKSVVVLQLDGGKEVALQVAETTKIMVGGKAGALLDIKPAAKATATWTEESNGEKVAQSISVS